MSPRAHSPAGAKVAVLGPVSAPREVRASFMLWLAAVAAGHSVGEFLAGANPMVLLFASSRVLHLIAVSRRWR